MFRRLQSHTPTKKVWEVPHRTNPPPPPPPHPGYAYVSCSHMYAYMYKTKPISYFCCLYQSGKMWPSSHYAAFLRWTGHVIVIRIYQRKSSVEKLSVAARLNAERLRKSLRISQDHKIQNLLRNNWFPASWNLDQSNLSSCLVTKPSKWLCAQRRLRSAWASVQSDQSRCCALNG